MILKIVLLSAIKIYRFFISPLLGRNNCRFYPTCSTYSKQALENFNVATAIYLIIRRLIKCHPFGTYDYDPLIINKDKV